jgi:hypothetical protein
MTLSRLAGLCKQKTWVNTVSISLCTKIPPNFKSFPFPKLLLQALFVHFTTIRYPGYRNVKNLLERCGYVECRIVFKFMKVFVYVL